MAQAKRDENRVPTLIGVSSADLITPTLVAADPATNRLLVSAIITAGGGGSDGAILDGVSSSISATVLDLTSSNPLTTAIVDGDGVQITSFGGGVQYTDLDVDSTPTGTVAMWLEDDDNIVHATSENNPLPVNVLNVPSGLALESKQDVAIGHLEDIVTLTDQLTNLIHVEDDPHSSAHKGVMPLAVRQDSLTALAADGDYIPLSTDEDGNLRVLAAIDTTGLATEAKQDDIIDILGEVQATPTANTVLSRLKGIRDDTTDIRTSLILLDNLPITEDIPYPAGADGIIAFGVRNDTLDTKVDTDGDITTFQFTADGGLWATITNTTFAVTSATFATLAEQQTQTTALQLIDDIVYVDDADWTDNTSKHALVGGVYQASPHTVTDGDVTPFLTDVNGRLVITGDEIGINDSGNSITVDNLVLSVVGSGTEATAQRVTIATDSTGVLSIDDNGGNISIDDGGNVITVDGTVAVTSATFATLAEQQTQTSSLSVLDDWDNTASDGASVSGDVAHDGADAGEPVKMGMKAVALKANPTEVAANDRTNWYADVSGVPFVLPGHPNILSQSLQVTDADGAQTDTAIITAAANVAVVVTKVSVTADEANTGGVSCRIGFGTANTPAADAAQVLLFHPGIAPGSGVVEGAGAGIIGIGASNEDVRVTCEDPAGGSINIIVTYFTTEI